MAQSNFYRNILKIFGANTVAQILTVAVSPILSRHFTPDSFGYSSLIVSTSTIIITILTLQYNQLILLENSKEKRERLFHDSLSILIVLSLLLILVSYILPSNFYSIIFKTEKNIFIIPIIFTSLFLGLEMIVRSIAQKEKIYTSIAKARTYQSLTGSSVKILSAFLWPSPIMLVYARILGAINYLIFLLSDLKNKLIQPYSLIKNIKELPQNIYQNKSFLIYTSLSGLLNNISNSMPVYIITFFWDKTSLGFFSFAFILVKMPIFLIGDALKQVVIQEFSDLVGNKNILTLKSRIKNLTIILLLITVVFSIPLLIWGRLIFIKIFGKNWDVAGVIAGSLVFMSCSVLIRIPYMAILTVLRKQKIIFNFQLILTIINSLLFILVAYFTKAFELSITIYSIIVFVSNLLFIFSSVLISKKELFKE